MNIHAEQISQLVDRAEGEWKGLIFAEYYTGGRLTDLARLPWSNVDLTDKTITFIQGKVEGKRSKAKVKIPIHPALEEYLLSAPADKSAYFAGHDSESRFTICRFTAPETPHQKS
jgi:integrase